MKREWIVVSKAAAAPGEPALELEGSHIAFIASDRAAVRGFFTTPEYHAA